MALVPCPVCGPAHDVRQLHDDVKAFRTELQTFLRTHPDNGFAYSMFEIVNRMHGTLETILQARVAAQRTVGGTCTVCKGRRQVDTHIWGTAGRHRG